MGICRIFFCSESPAQRFVLFLVKWLVLVIVQKTFLG